MGLTSQENQLTMFSLLLGIFRASEYAELYLERLQREMFQQLVVYTSVSPYCTCGGQSGMKLSIKQAGRSIMSWLILNCTENIEDYLCTKSSQQISKDLMYFMEAPSSPVQCCAPSDRANYRPQKVAI